MGGGRGGQKTATLQVPDELVSGLLGKGGVTIKEFMATSGCRIKISQKGEFMPGTMNRIVTIIGEDHGIEIAQRLINDRLVATESHNMSHGSRSHSGGDAYGASSSAGYGSYYAPPTGSYDYSAYAAPGYGYGGAGGYYGASGTATYGGAMGAGSYSAPAGYGMTAPPAGYGSAPSSSAPPSAYPPGYGYAPAPAPSSQTGSSSPSKAGLFTIPTHLLQ